MRLAIEDESNPSDVDYINVHGTSTPLGDIRNKAIKSLFSDHI